MTNEKQNPKEVIKGLILITVIIVFIIVLIPDCGDKNKEPEKQKSFSKIEAYVSSQQFVEDKLKSPGTAKFGYDPEKIIVQNDTVFYIGAYVDSENSYGGMMRTNYSCKIIFDTSKDIVICENLILD